MSEAESGAEGVTDADDIERGAAALFKHAGLTNLDDGSVVYESLGEPAKTKYRNAVRAILSAVGPRLASAAKAEARVRELEEEIHERCESLDCYTSLDIRHEGCDGLFCAHGYCQECGAMLVTSSERAEPQVDADATSELAENPQQ